MSSCERCLFCSTFRDMGASSKYCSLRRDLCQAIKAYDENMRTNDCQYCIFVCDLIDALASFDSLPDLDILSSYGYIWSKESKERSLNRNLSLSILRVSCRDE